MRNQPGKDTDSYAEKLEKTKLIYELARNHYNEETERFRKLDEKAARLFSFVTIMVGAYGFFGKWLLDSLKLPLGSWDWGLVIIGLLVAIALVISWVCIISALPMFVWQKPSCDLETFKELSAERLINVYVRLARTYADCLAVNREKTGQKSVRLTSAYCATVVAGCCFLVLVILFSWQTLSSRSIPKPKGNSVYYYDTVELGTLGTSETGYNAHYRSAKDVRKA